jgi:hypothetical protein
LEKYGLIIIPEENNKNENKEKNILSINNIEEIPLKSNKLN